MKDIKSQSVSNLIGLANTSKKISYDKLRNITSQISESNLIVQAEKGYDNYDGNSLSGVIINFSSFNKKYLFVGLTGGQVSNDHYPYYEFLLSSNNSNLLKQQMFFADFAGEEGAEYCNFAPPIEFLTLLCCLLIIALLKGIKLLFKK